MLPPRDMPQTLPFFVIQMEGFSPCPSAQMGSTFHGPAASLAMASVGFAAGMHELLHVTQLGSVAPLSQVQSPPRRARPGAPRLWRPNLQLRGGRQPAHREAVREPLRHVNASAKAPRTAGRG